MQSDGRSADCKLVTINSFAAPRARATIQDQDRSLLVNPVKQPRVALCGINLETNAFSPVSTEDDFRSMCYLEGEELLTDVRSAAAKATQEVVGFVSAMDATGPWKPVPLVFGWCHPWGPVDQKFFDYMVDEMIRRIEANGGVDAISWPAMALWSQLAILIPTPTCLSDCAKPLDQTYRSSEHWIFTPTFLSDPSPPLIARRLPNQSAYGHV